MATIQQIELDNYKIEQLDENTLWIAHISGEGMQVLKEDFEELVREYFEDNF